MDVKKTQESDQKQSINNKVNYEMKIEKAWNKKGNY